MTDSAIHIESRSPVQTQALAAAFAKRLQGGDLVTLEGELGAGKTVFVRGLAEGLGLSPSVVSSPTFVIRQEYSCDAHSATVECRGGIKHLVHIDAYRISSADDLETIGWSELQNDIECVIALEWPSRLPETVLPRRCVAVKIEHVNHTTRNITITVPREMADRLIELHTEQAAMKCRKCGNSVLPSAATFPFCSQRCKLADLGQWFRGGYRVSREIQSDDEFD